MFYGYEQGPAQNVTAGAASAQSTVMGASTFAARVVSKVDVWYKRGVNPTADTTTSQFLPAGVVLIIPIFAGEKLAVIQDSAGGTVNIQPLTT